MAAYTIYLLNRPDPAVQTQIEAKAAELGLPPQDLDFREDDSEPTTGLSVAIYWGPNNTGAANPQAATHAAALVQRGTPFLPVHSPNRFTTEIPDCLRQVNGFDKSRGFDALANLALESLQLMRRRRRLFVSYLRKEATAVARQLYELLDERGYDVFLDTKSLQAGVQFQEELVEYLADSDLVIFLHSPGADFSKWVNIERGRAEKLGIHVLEILWPGTTQSQAALFNEPKDLPPGETIDVTINGELTHQLLYDPAKLADLAESVERKRARALADRQRGITGSFLDVAREETMELTEYPPNEIHVKLSTGDQLDLIIALGVFDAREVQRIDQAPTKRTPSRGILYDGGSFAPASASHAKWLKDFGPVGLYNVNTLLEGSAKVEEWLKDNTVPTPHLKPVFLSASIPYPRKDGKDVTAYLADLDRDAIREAVLALVRIVLPRTELHYGGHPAITPFVAQVALDEGEERLKRVKVFQSELWRKFYPEDNRVFQGITFIPPSPDKDREKSLLSMREAMLQRYKSNPFSAGFFIGGMDGVEDEYRHMRDWHPDVPCFLVGSTASAAGILSRTEEPRSPLERKYRTELNENRHYGPLFRRILRDLTRL